VKPHRKLPHIAVVGAGYAGLPFAMRLIHLAKDKCRISVINPDPKQELTCDLYRTLRTGRSYLLPFSKMLKQNGIDFIEGSLHEIEPDKNLIHVRSQSAREIHYDKLVLATGLHLKNPEIGGLKELLDQDRESMRKRIFSFKKNIHAHSLRLAMTRIGWGDDKRTSSKDNFVVILGAGSTGLEVAGELAALRGRNSKDRIIIVDEKSKLLNDFSPFASKTLNKKLRKMNIETVLGSAVVSANESEIHLQSGQVIPWELLVLCTGTLAAPSWSEGISNNPFEKGFSVTDQFQFQKFEDIYAIGDLARYQRHPRAQNSILPKRAQFAYQSGKYLASHLSNELHKNKKASDSFKETDLGYLVSLGPKDGIARLGPPIQSKFGRALSPFIQGQKVDHMKRLIRLNYLLQLRAERFKLF